LAYFRHNSIDPEILLELRDVFSNEASAIELLGKIDFPSSQIPTFELSTSFWRDVAHHIRSGVVENGAERLVAAAATMYPGNDVFRRKPRSASGEQREAASSGPRIQQITKSDITFDDIGGYDEIKNVISRELQVRTMLAHLDLKLQSDLMTRGYVFHGPPGNGKTLFAKAIANHLQANLLVFGPDVTGAQLGEIFAKARRSAPAVLLFDEFETVASQRSGPVDGGSRAGNAVVSQLAAEIDAFNSESPILVVGTTNRLDLVDPSLFRPSRFQAIEIGYPDQSARHAIAQIHARKFQINAPPELLEQIALATSGFCGDEIQSVFRDACLGTYCDPQIPADARRLGALVGQRRVAIERHRTQVSYERAGTRRMPGTAWPTLNRRLAPSGAMRSLRPRTSEDR
jgi:transitional endoplasmic reticulum ATPase